MTMPKLYTGADVLPFPRTPLNMQNNHQNQVTEKHQAAERVSSSTTTERTLPLSDKSTRQMLAMEELKMLYFDTIGREIPRAIAEPLLRDIREGTPAQYYRYAMEQTLLAPRPSWRYTLAIVARLKRTNCPVWEMDYRPHQED